ncbi:MAG: sporulation transcriptional regulator SpoIIID [Clostridia bacterium]|nr:sporulation transcriptional regulator SpoIIID [Clostridia bacterium]
MTLILSLRKVTSVHKDVSERLLKINPALASEVREILDENKAERHIRGGMATKLKYSKRNN